MKNVIAWQTWLGTKTLKSFVTKGINVIGIAPEGTERFSEVANQRPEPKMRPWPLLDQP